MFGIGYIYNYIWPLLDYRRYFRCNIYDNISFLEYNRRSLHKFDHPELHINAVFNLPKLSISVEFF